MRPTPAERKHPSAEAAPDRPTMWERGSHRARRLRSTIDPDVALVMTGAVLLGVALRWLVLDGPLGYLDYDEAAGDWTVYQLDAWLPPWEAGMVVFGGQLTEEIARRPPTGTD